MLAIQSSTRALLLLVLVVALPVANGVDVKSIFEQKCLKTVPKSVEVDFDWASKVGTWYMSGGNQLHAYRTAAEVAGVKEADLVPHDLYYRACLRFVWGEKTLVRGFGGKQIDCGLKPEADGTGFNFRYSSLGLDGKATIVLTDNETFVMHYVCWPKKDEASYAVISSVPVLSKKAKKSILKKVKEMGFSEKQFTVLRYESCDADEADGSDKDEL